MRVDRSRRPGSRDLDGAPALVLGATGAVLSEELMHVRMESLTYGYSRIASTLPSGR